MYVNMEEEGEYVIQKFKYKLLKIKYLVHKPLAVPKLLLFVSRVLLNALSASVADLHSKSID